MAFPKVPFKEKMARKDGRFPEPRKPGQSDYRWWGYAEVLADKAVARKGLGTIMAEALSCEGFRSDWRRTNARYRLFF